MIETNKIYNEDCRVTMKRMENNLIDLTITSPPYDNLRTYNNNIDKTWNENVWKEIIKELFRITKKGGVVVWVVADATIKGSETGTSFKQALYAKEIGFNLHDTMIFNKICATPVGGQNRYYQKFEYMFVFSKGKPKTFNPIMRKRRNKHNDKRTERIRKTIRNKDGSWDEPRKIIINEIVKEGNVWDINPSNPGNRIESQHPAIFCVDLCTKHLISWSNENDIVYDPFMGSGTTAISCIRKRRKYIGSEISKKYCNLAMKRIELYQEQLELF